MEVSAKSSITFSISGILSTSTEQKKRSKSASPPSLIRHQNNYTQSDNRCYAHVISSPDYRYHDSQSYIESMPQEIFSSNYERYSKNMEEQKSDWSKLRPVAHYSSPLNGRAFNSSPLDKTVSEKRVSPTGRFRPPPFFETVLALRKRLYYLGGRVFATDEPPTDRNIHKLWRAVEKHKVNYSLQHYFYVASLSNRCFDLVERINHKVTLGLLEGSREKEVNQSYFNFLYGKTEEERFHLLSLLEKGQKSPKDFVKSKQVNGVSKPSNEMKSSSSSCRNCEQTATKLRAEKRAIEEKYASLKRKYDLIVSNDGKVTDEITSETKRAKYL